MENDGDFIQPEAQTLTYDKYLKVHELLALQNELSEPKEHDETLFIIIHQAYELWFKQILHELERCQNMLGAGELIPVLRSLKRVDTIQKVLVHQVDILETMTPNDFNRFRSGLNPASGFQSHQFRLLEFTIGLKEPGYLKFFRHDESTYQRLKDRLKRPSLYDDFLSYLAAQGFDLPSQLRDKDPESPHKVYPELIELFAGIYRDHRKYYELYMACEAMIDLDQQLTIWRYRHVAMVQRMIGEQKGTGGSMGAQYLQKTLNKRAFPELWLARDRLGSDY